LILYFLHWSWANTTSTYEQNKQTYKLL